MKFIAIDTFNQDKLTEMAMSLNIKVRGRRDYTKTWANAVRKELISRAVKGGKQVKLIARKAVRGCVAGLNFTIDALTSSKAKELYRNVGVLLSGLWAILWWVATFLWEIADGALGKLIGDRCQKLPAEIPTPQADLEPIRPIVPAVRKLRSEVKQQRQIVGNGFGELSDTIAEFADYLQSRNPRKLMNSAIYLTGTMAIALAANLI